MKKLLICGAVAAVLTVLIFVSMLSNPNYAIIGISQSSSANYGEMLLVKRDHTYEQVVHDKKKSRYIFHSGKWLPASDDASSRSLGEFAKIPLDNYVTFEDKLYQGAQVDTWRKNDSLEPAMWNRPNAQSLTLWKKWRAQAKPLDTNSLAQ